MKHQTLAQRLGFGAKPTTANPKPKPKAPRETKPPRVRDTSTGIDARQLSPDDYERRLAQLGFSAPGIERHLAPPIDPEAQRVARRALERAERRAGRDHARALEARTAEVNAGAIDGRNASPDEVRARMASLGIETHDLAVRPVGKPLPPSRNQADAATRHSTLEADREVARAVQRATQAGQPFDARKLTPGELRALLELRGI